ncbi:MAG: GH32 C-terminal domain-containing protein, partial [Anaeroplasmataceae bacterium]|nr:GH32 C-terminal domain-containing protein [Anaeroplasmataceae bacterium]
THHPPLPSPPSRGGGAVVNRLNNHTYSSCHVRLLLDVSSIEVFIANGKETISSRIYLNGDYTIVSNEAIRNLQMKEVGV